MTSSSRQSPAPSFTVPGMKDEVAAELIRLLQQRLHALNDLALTLKHVHWNVVGPHFIGVHEMLDPQVDAVRAMVDEIAERIATLAARPSRARPARWSRSAPGTTTRSAAPTPLRISVPSTSSTRASSPTTARPPTTTEETDPVTNDMLIGHLHQIELFHWFVRAHLENAGGTLSTAGQQGEQPAADAASRS